MPAGQGSLGLARSILGHINHGGANTGPDHSVRRCRRRRRRRCCSRGGHGGDGARREGGPLQVRNVADENIDAPAE